ncbi:2,5-dihydroxypyridine 5,6-dioxygenase [Paenirhodobacter hankyongi]|uniref:2,5-dihydroxypyridine 5,6-dioxygenase n=1 Tax=Paenirhodobacter hankyongi TaxID=2294033 RepID=A0A421BLQ3_9RHOB|nr:2,5-dihydroxypyridine 5,6-dioxygenase [Sinirhodobacter hankyongi]RLL63960.1 2,5-dihydroxypyridine 5,6-dioxygenase [Sinirhodobacter hankyongi]
MISDADFVIAWKDVLEQCRLQPGEQVAILTSDDSNMQIVNCARIAIGLLGGVLTMINLPPINGEKALSRDKSGYVGKTPLAFNTAALAALKAADLVIDTMQMLFSPEQEQILKTGTRMLLAVEPPETMLRMIPTPEAKDKVKRASVFMGQAREMTVTSKAGTDFRCRLGQYPVLEQFGLADEPGRWDHWPSCMIARWPDEGSAEGQIVIDAGDILLPFKRYATDRTVFTVEKGIVTRIEGGVTAEYIRSFMETFRDPDAYYMAHVGWGLEHRASWTTLGLYDREAALSMDSRCYEGNFLFSTGPNTEAGGHRDTPCHLDIPLRGCSVSLDGVAMTVDGRVVHG